MDIKEYIKGYFLCTDIRDNCKKYIELSEKNKQLDPASRIDITKPYPVLNMIRRYGGTILGAAGVYIGINTIAGSLNGAEGIEKIFRGIEGVISGIFIVCGALPVGASINETKSVKLFLERDESIIDHPYKIGKPYEKLDAKLDGGLERFKK